MADQQPPAKPTRTFKPRTGVQRRTKAERDAFAAEEAKRAEEAAAAAAAAAAKALKSSTRRAPAAGSSRKEEVKQGDSAGVFGSAAAERPSTRRALGAGIGSEEVVLGSSAADCKGAFAKPAASYASGGLRARVGGGGGGGGDNDDDAEPYSGYDDFDEPTNDIEDIGRSDSEDDGTRLRPLRAPNRVEPDDADKEDVRDTDEVDVVKEQPSSPEQARRKTVSSTSRTKEVKFAHETDVERTERRRAAEDVDLLRHAFLTNAALHDDADKEKGKEREETEEADHDDGGKLFLLQFPPLTPLLIDPSTGSSQRDDGGGDNTTVTIKREPDAGAPAAAAAAAAAASNDPSNPIFTACSDRAQLPPSGGLVGKLNVHASGKVTLDWGGVDMEVRVGTGVNFLQDAVLLHTVPEERADSAHADKEPEAEDTPVVHAASAGPVASRGATPQQSSAFALGQIDARMVVVPDWSKLYD